MIAIPQITGDEKRLLDFLLAGESPILEELRHQLVSAQVRGRERTVTGFFLHLEVAAQAPRIQTAPDLVIGDVRGWVDGIDCGILLFVRGGVLDFVECRTWRDETLDSEATVGALEYLPGSTPGAKPPVRGRARKRDLEALHRSWNL